MCSKETRVWVPFLWVVLLAVLVPASASAHEIPNDVTVQALFKPLGQQLHLLVRVPLEAMQDIEWPTRGPGYLDVAASDALLPDAATLWLANDIEIYEDDLQLSSPRVVATRVSLPSDRSFRTYEEALTHLTGPAAGR